MPILKNIRKVLNILKKYAYPNYKSQLSVYDLYKDEQIKKYLENKELIKTIYIENKLINFIIK